MCPAKQAKAFKPTEFDLIPLHEMIIKENKPNDTKPYFG